MRPAATEMTYRYLRDPCFLLCLFLFLANRYVFIPQIEHPFFKGYLNDLICLPFWVPIMLQGSRWLGFRRHDRPPDAWDILLPLLGFTLVFEIWIPGQAGYQGYFVADPWDVLAYATGALSLALWVRWFYGLFPLSPSSAAR